MQMAVTAVVVARMTSTATSARPAAYSKEPSAKQRMETVLRFTSFGVRRPPVTAAGGWSVRRHPSGGRVCKFQREVIPPNGHYRDGLPFQNDSAAQTGLACSGLRT